MIRLLVAVLLVAYVATAAWSGAWWDIPATELLTLGASFGPAVAGGESWRLGSAIFLHGGLPHLLFNSLALWEVGRPLERKIGWPDTLAIFLLAGASGFFVSLFWHHETISVGASGGIFGLLGTWAVQAWQALSKNEGAPDTAHAASGKRGRMTIAVVLLLALGSGFLIPNVDHAAHLGGLAVGLLLGALTIGPKWRSLVFFASCTVLAASLFAATRFLPAEWSVEYQETRDYAAFYRAFADEERAISAALQAIIEASRANQLSEDEGLARLNEDILPRLGRAAEKMRATRWQTRRLAEDNARWTRYTQLRLDAVSALRNAIAIENGTVARNELLRFELLMTEAARLANPQAVKNAMPPDHDGR